MRRFIPPMLLHYAAVDDRGRAPAGRVYEHRMEAEEKAYEKTHFAGIPFHVTEVSVGDVLFDFSGNGYKHGYSLDYNERGVRGDGIPHKGILK